MVTVIVDFEEDINELIKYIKRKDMIDQFDFLIFYHPRIKEKIVNLDFAKYHEKNMMTKLKLIRSIQSSLFIIIDNYVPELGAIKLHHSKICIQTWHANGALKKFGLDVPVPYDKRDVKRFKNVYQQYDSILVGSENMKRVFKTSFHIENDHTFLEIGTLRMDKYFRTTMISETLKNRLKTINPNKIILYTPTYREHHNSPNLNFSALNELKKAGYIIILRTHPTVTISIPDKYKEFILNGNQYELEELIRVSDILVTDYSSVAMEFSIQYKPIYFFSYDLEEYKKNPGLIDDYEEEVCSPIYKDIPTLQEAILNEAVNINDVKVFNEKWNTYTNGSACASLVSYMESRKERYEVTS